LAVAIVAKSIARLLPSDPPKRHLIPFGYCDQMIIARISGPLASVM
jgi:hypothetical protein